MHRLRNGCYKIFTVNKGLAYWIFVVVGGVNGGPVTCLRLFCLYYGRARETGKSHRNRMPCISPILKWEDSCDGQTSSLDKPPYPRQAFTPQDGDILTQPIMDYEDSVDMWTRNSARLATIHRTVPRRIPRKWLLCHVLNIWLAQNMKKL